MKHESHKIRHSIRYRQLNVGRMRFTSSYVGSG
jgi:hypothetical protein